MTSIHALYLFCTALALAFLEVQIEGKHGWASRLPTWRPEGRWYDVLYRRLMGGKALTGYHIGVFGMMLLLLHYPFVAGAPFSLYAEALTLSVCFLFSVFWDYLWIIINPHYGVIRRRPKYDVFWHAHWWGPFPRDYYIGIALSALAVLPFWTQNSALLYDWLRLLGIFVGGTVTALIAVELLRGDVARQYRI